MLGALQQVIGLLKGSDAFRGSGFWFADRVFRDLFAMKSSFVAKHMPLV
jgi:hypothetical protein